MRLYHFTSLGHLPVILATGGLWRGEVPVGDGSESLRGTWFTSDPDPRGHGLDGSSADKREVRITVVLRHGDRALAHWLKFARGRLASDCIEELMRTGGGKRKAETWYVYPSQIPPSQFRAIELRREGGCYSPASADEIAAAIPHEGLLEAVTEEFREIRAKIA
ncbi:MAG: hypothetical protein MIN69_00430 [Methylorubrum extorquens]|jgi:hypothetical protein|uniref:hypothetical protein n=1 Tax=Methylorubrum extorquens TaxID=408 RepID=UPI002FEE2BDB